MTYRELYEEGKGALAAAGIAEADIDAGMLLEFICGTDRNTLLIHGDREVSGEEEVSFRALLDRRRDRIPLQQLTGIQNFMGLDFCVNEHVLIPRQDTEILVEEVLQNLHDGMRILDMCTGSGCILISLLHYSNNCTGVGADISAEALEVARENAGRLLEGRHVETLPEFLDTVISDCAVTGMDSLGSGADMDDLQKTEFIQSNLFQNVTGQFDVIVSNPPYIQTPVIDTLMPEVRDHEPRLALDGSEDGLWFYREIVRESADYLKRGGMLFFEIGYDQGEAVSRLMEQAGFLEVCVRKDYAGLDRVVYGTRGFGMIV